MTKLKGRVICAMSGGVDSSVAAALLKKDGCDVFGVFMRLNDFSADSEKRAKKVAKILDIPFQVLDLRKEFKKRVVNYFLDGYKKGITPNPCVVCNKEMKFGLFLEKALKLGADYIATGHYARILPSEKHNNFSQRKNFILLSASDSASRKPCSLACEKFSSGSILAQARDKEKDQSYFLWKLNQKKLKRVLFPVGNYTRVEVERLAKKFKLPFSNIKKSVEICFVPKTTEDFLKKYLKLKKGDIIDIRGEVLGKHGGLPLYTIGQRKGIGLAGGPYYVAAKNFRKNQLIVTKNEKDLLKKEVLVKDVNWISPVVERFAFTTGQAGEKSLKVQVKIRYRSPSTSAIISKLDAKRHTLTFTKPQRAVTPGQSAVFYLDQVLLGGGIIC